MLQSIRHDEMTDICHLVKDTEKSNSKQQPWRPINKKNANIIWSTSWIIERLSNFYLVVFGIKW